MKFLFALLFTITSAHAACELSFPQANLCADLTWTQGPVVNQASAFTLKFDRAYAPYKLKVDLWMQMGQHGHGTRPVVLRSADETTVEVTQAWFVMRGSWLVRAFLMNDAGAVVESAQSEIQL